MRGAATKSRWNDCEKAALALGVTKSNVFHYLYDELVQAGILHGVCNNNETAVRVAKELPGYTRILAANQIKIHAENSNEKPSEELAQKLGIAVWFIKKAGSIEEAQALLNAAKSAMKILSKEKT